MQLMAIKEVIEIATAIVFSLGGPSLLVIALSTWLGKVWAARVLEKDRLKYHSELEKYKSGLDKAKVSFLRFSDYQFKLYNDLWNSLMDLRLAGESLWSDLNEAKTW